MYFSCFRRIIFQKLFIRVQCPNSHKISLYFETFSEKSCYFLIFMFRPLFEKILAKSSSDLKRIAKEIETNKIVSALKIINIYIFYFKLKFVSIGARSSHEISTKNKDHYSITYELQIKLIFDRMKTRKGEECKTT